jgi:hypothetical protein
MQMCLSAIFKGSFQIFVHGMVTLNNPIVPVAIVTGSPYRTNHSITDSSRQLLKLMRLERQILLLDHALPAVQFHLLGRKDLEHAVYTAYLQVLAKELNQQFLHGLRQDPLHSRYIYNNYSHLFEDLPFYFLLIGENMEDVLVKVTLQPFQVASVHGVVADAVQVTRI